MAWYWWVLDITIGVLLLLIPVAFLVSGRRARSTSKDENNNVPHECTEQYFLYR